MICLSASLLYLATFFNAAHSADAPRLATFRVDITTPLGSPLCGGGVPPRSGLDDPLWAKGIVLDDGQHRYVLCGLDWCEIRNSAHNEVRDAIAQAVGTDRSRVAVQSLHPHDAPIIDVDAQQLVDAHANSPALCDVDDFRKHVASLALAAGEAVSRLQPFDHVGTGTATVHRVASSRRIPVDGRMTVRYSSASDPALRALPEGLIDPLIRTITFLDGDQPLARIHYYATHPQSYYGTGRVTGDFPAIARDRFEREEGVFQIYFTGAGGNVAAGKYNDGTPLARVQLTDQLTKGMRAAVAATTVTPVGEFSVRTVDIRLLPRNDGHWSAERTAEIIADPQANASARRNAAFTLAYRNRADQPIDLTAISIGNITILHLPGEPFVEYQLFAQSLAPDRFIAVAGYGDGGPGYLCTEVSYTEGGYEPTSSMVVPESEAILRSAIRQLLTNDE